MPCGSSIAEAVAGTDAIVHLASAAHKRTTRRVDMHGTRRLLEAAEGHRPQMGRVLLESLRQPVVFVRRSHFLVAVRHISDRRNRARVTPGSAGCRASRFGEGIRRHLGGSTRAGTDKEL
jgi:hypothetical protein